MKPSTAAHRAILAAFERFGNTLTAAQLEAARDEFGCSKRAWERERARMAKECDGKPPLIKRSRIGNGSPQSGDGTVTWTRLRPNMTRHDVRGMHAFLADIQHASDEPVPLPSPASSKYRFGSRKYWHERNRRECDAMREAQEDEGERFAADEGAEPWPPLQPAPCERFVSMENAPTWCETCRRHCSTHPGYLARDPADGQPCWWRLPAPGERVGY